MMTPNAEGNLELDLVKYEVGGILELDAGQDLNAKESETEVEIPEEDFETDCLKGWFDDSQNSYQAIMNNIAARKYAAAMVNNTKLSRLNSKIKEKQRKKIIKKGLILQKATLVSVVQDFLESSTNSQIVYRFCLLPENSKSVKKFETFDIPEGAILSYEPPCEMALLTHNLPEIRQAIIKKRHIDISAQIRKYITESKFSTFKELIDMLVQHFGDNRFPRLVSAVEKLTGQDQSKFFETFIEMRSILLER